MSDSLSHVDTKECKSCLKEKHIQDFATYTKSGQRRYRHTCKECKRKREKIRLSKPIESLPLFDDNEMPRKKCRACLEWKQDHDFNSGKVICKECEEKKKREEDLFSIEMTRLRQRNADARFHSKHPLARKTSKLKREYSLTYEEYHKMFVAQNNRCAICNNSPEEGKILYVDHDHETGAVRGLLCYRCNTLLGMASDKTDILDSAIRYLHRNTA